MEQGHETLPTVNNLEVLVHGHAARSLLEVDHLVAQPYSQTRKVGSQRHNHHGILNEETHDVLIQFLLRRFKGHCDAEGIAGKEVDPLGEGCFEFRGSRTSVDGPVKRIIISTLFQLGTGCDQLTFGSNSRVGHTQGISADILQEDIAGCALPGQPVMEG